MKINIILLLLPAALCSFAQHTLSEEGHVLSGESHMSSTSGSGWAGFILGPILFFCSFVCIWYNEKRAAIDSRRLQLGREICEDVDVTSQQSAISKDGKLVYASGQTRTSAVTMDPLSGVAQPNLIKIRREVQVMQWREKTRKENDRTVTYYQLEWVSSNLSNAGSRYNNPANWFINSETFYNTQVYLGGYLITKDVADKCSKVLPYTPTREVAENILSRTGRRDRQPAPQGEYIYFSATGSPQGQYGQYAPSGPSGEGSLRVRFLLCPTGPLSLVGQSTGGNPGANFTSFNIARADGSEGETNSIPSCCCCFISACYAEMLKPIELLLEVHEEFLTKEQIFDKAVEKSECFTKIIRILAFVCMVAGICLFFSPITTLLGYIPLVGGLISGIVGFAIFLAAVLISIPLYLLMISIAWLVFHPKVGLILLIIAAAVTTLVLVLGAKHDDQPAAATTAHFGALLRREHI